MFLLTRCALCIGLVAVAASRIGPGEVTGAVERGMRQAGTAAAGACLRSDACAGVGASILQRAATLSPADPDPAGAGPPPRSPARPAPRRDAPIRRPMAASPG